MKPTIIKTLQANLLKEAFGLAIKEQERLIVEKQNAIDNGFNRILVCAVVPYKEGQLEKEIAEHKGYIEFYSAMYLHAEDARIAISEERIHEFYESYVNHQQKVRKSNSKEKV